MYQKDYILRMIEMIGDLIAAVIGKIKEGNTDQARDEIGKIYWDILKKDASFFSRISKDQLTDRLLEEHNYNNGHLLVLAELFNAEAELYHSTGEYDLSVEYSEKSLVLFEFLDKLEKTFSMERIKKMESIRHRIEILSKR